MPIKRKILLIEDNPHWCKILSTRFNNYGFRVIIANDGLSGFALAKIRRPDIIILDLTLPKLPGEEICRQIRKDEDKDFAKTPIIMFTSKESDVDRVIGRVIGANVYLKKSIGIEHLLSEINRLIPEKEQQKPKE